MLVRTFTEATPFSLVYGMETVLPIEVEIPSLRILSELKLDEAKWVQSRYDQLNLIEEKRLRAIRHGQMYQKRMMRAYNKKTPPQSVHEGDLVLKKILPMQKDFRGKWIPNWEGPHVVKKAFSGGALILAEMDGKNFPNPVNSNSVKNSLATLELTMRKYVSSWGIDKHRPHEINSTEVEQIEDRVEQIKNYKSYLHLSAMEQTEDYSLISTEQEWSRLKIVDLISTEQEWSRSKTARVEQIENYKSYLHVSAMEQTEDYSLISTEQEWSKIKIANLISTEQEWSKLKIADLISTEQEWSRSKTTSLISMYRQ
ncbi:RNA-directed DNA polymerase (Reverse transcriptase), Ribonuclease H [Gossypium australe]|uniref:RNA-directed DNA polymerase (Reverse transcriptase), Ribonuclease H n=1 Tax=Gossypium australe TaxID=47621 RepID=A0A5B6WSE4_9ROSI|nr:RNA-directed DNA polymerase (Reverse transcriptase), Ribonuclease H [Gossypium australe]